MFELADVPPTLALPLLGRGAAEARGGTVPSDRLPGGFRITRDEDTLRVHLPPVVRTASHVFDPVLTRADAERVADAVVDADLESPLDRIVLVRDPDSPVAASASFRERLLVLLIDAGMELPLDVEAARPHERERDLPLLPRV